MNTFYLFIYSACAAAMIHHHNNNIHTGYDRVLRAKTKILEALACQPGAQAKLTHLYQQNKWLEITDKPNADELVTLALGRIKQDPHQYDVFVTMLSDIMGMDIVTKKIRSGE